MTLLCDNGNDSPYGPLLSIDGAYFRIPEVAYSQNGHYFGLCLNCLDDHYRDQEFMETEVLGLDGLLFDMFLLTED